MVLRRACARRGIETGAAAAAKAQLAAQMVVLERGRAHLAAGIAQQNRQMRAQLLAAQQGMQELAAHLQRRPLGQSALAQRLEALHRDIAQQLHLAAVTVADGTPRGGQQHRAVGREGAQAHAVDLQRVGIGIVAHLAALDPKAQRASGVEALQLEALHAVVGHMARRHRLHRPVQQRRVLDQPPGAGGQKSHQEQRQIGRGQRLQPPQPALRQAAPARRRRRGQGHHQGWPPSRVSRWLLRRAW
ncbi:hypothetical protein PEC18_05675 [Paucibacter sp. O1-1]|nr:hypothetical protein [Paucibacter sp. O1-1]MDA3825358.1 hypothetical protein [Paucibacter sp. O1-1]